MPLQFDIEEWQDADAVPCAEHRATWGRLRITANGFEICELSDKNSRSTRNAIYISLYPIAEWIATRWFPLLYEAEVPDRGTEAGFRSRHSLRFAGEGFAVPALSMMSEGDMVRLQWQALDLPEADIRFLSSGELRCPRGEVKIALRIFVEKVLERLADELPARKTLLHEEWEALTALDSEEKDFCKTAGCLGLDPFSITAELESEIASIYERIPVPLRNSFFAAAPVGSLRTCSEWVREGLSKAEASLPRACEQLPSMRRFATDSFPSSSVVPPWNAGYEFARRLRKYLSLDSEPLTPDDFDEKLGFACAIEFQQDMVGFDAITVRDPSTDSGAFVLAGTVPASKRFAYARSLMEYLVNPNTKALVSRAVTNDQRRNRAFAAELLAPAEGIRKRLAGSPVSGEQVEEIADEFRVSTYVIEHQIENHNLGHVLFAAR